jgi:hypothetical protein
MTASFFKRLDLDQDGFLSRQELYTAAMAMGWGWYEAPLFALLDLFTIPGPLSQKQFTSYLTEISNDPFGPYGKVLRHAPLFVGHPDHRELRYPLSAQTAAALSPDRRTADSVASDTPLMAAEQDGLDRAADIAADRRRIDGLKALACDLDSLAVLLIDPQRSFTSGAWMQSIGAQASEDVGPIQQAFNNCSVFLETYYHHLEVMFTRCPFPPASYQWDAQLDGRIDPDQLYFIKPGNSVLFPPHNGYRDWIARCMQDGKNILLIGGCTLNSCVRVSAIETQKLFGGQNLQVVVDLSLCGARLRNYGPTSQFDGLSAVESAVQQMKAVGVNVVKQLNSLN